MAKNSKVWAGITLFAVLGTSLAQAQLNGPVFRDNFDLYANDTELGAVWLAKGTPSPTLSTAQSVTAPNSLFSINTTGSNRYHVFAGSGEEMQPTDADPIVVKFKYYDTHASANTRKSCSLHSTPGWSATSDWWIEFGTYGPSSATQYFIRTVNLGGPNWTAYPGSVRSVGWHEMRMEVGQTFIKFQIDALPVYQVAINAAGKTFTTVACGGVSNLYSALGDAYYDDIHVSFLSDENACGSCGFVPNVSVDEILLSGADTVEVSNVNPNALKVTVYASATGQAPWTEIGSSTSTPFASTVPISVSPALVSGDWIIATQTMEMSIPGCPTEILEGCLISNPVNVVDGCAQIPAVTPVGLVDAGRTSVLVGGVDLTAEAVKVYAYDAGTDTTSLIGTNAAPGGESVVQVDVSPALVQGQVIRATQTMLGLEGCVPTTGGRGVGAPGVIEDFEGPVSRYDHPSPGVSGAWYDVSAVSYTDVLIPTNARATLLGSRCVNITDHGWTNGAYVIYENIIPADGTYHLTLDMLIDEYEGCDYDFYNQYKVGVIVNGVHREPTGGVIPNILSPVGSYPCLTPNRDGADATEPTKVYVDTFTANAGDSLLIAFSTTLEGYSRSKTATPAGYVGMKVDNITLVDGPKPPNCLDVPVVEVVPTEFYPFEAGVTKLTVRNIDPNATQVRLFADDVQIGSASPGGATQLDINVTPLVAGTTLTGTQTVGGIESCQCPGAAGPMVGEGKNSGVLVTLGIRETGAAGGTTGTIEWVGATKGVDGQPLGKELPTSPAWQEMTFAWPLAGGTDPVVAFSGNGVVEGDFGVLESFNITINSENNGRYVLYIDSIMNGDTVVADFEAYAAGTRAVFRLPSNSGSTDSNLLAYPDMAEVDGTEAADGSQSYHVEWQFLDNHVKRWLRLTTVGPDTELPGADPLIDLTKPITVKFLLYGEPPCGLVWADDDKDGDVDMDDFAALQRCLTIGVTSGDVPDECLCFDHPFDGAIGADDVASFINCAAGAGVVLESCP